MGHIYVDVEICNQEKTKCKKLQALVDTGATLTVIPRHIANELNIKPIRTDNVQTGAGIVKVDRGVAIITIKGKETITEVWISDIIDKVLIGVVTLELLGFRLDPQTGELIPSPMLLY